MSSKPSSPPRRNKRNLFRFFILKNQPPASLFLIFTSVPSAQKRHLSRTALQKKTNFNKEICLFQLNYSYYIFSMLFYFSHLAPVRAFIFPYLCGYKSLYVFIKTYKFPQDTKSAPLQA